MSPIQNTASALPEDSFVGIDPEDTATVEVGSAKFEVRVLPAGLWDILTVGDTKLYRNSQRAAIARLTAAGRDCNEKAFPEDPQSNITILDLETTGDQEYVLARTQKQLEVIRFGVINHTGLKTRRGEIPFETEETTMGGKKFTVLSQKALRVYEVNQKIRMPVYMAIFRLNTLGEVSKKA